MNARRILVKELCWKQPLWSTRKCEDNIKMDLRLSSWRCKLHWSGSGLCKVEGFGISCWIFWFYEYNQMV